MPKNKIDFSRAALRPRVVCDTCSWMPPTMQGNGYVCDLREARVRAGDHLHHNPDHQVVAEQVTVTSYRTVS